MYNETTRLVRVIEVPLVADENESDAPGEVAEAAPKGATKEPVRGESDDQQTGVTYKLSDTAGNLWIADGVVAMFTDDTGKTHYAQLAKKEIANGSAKSGDAPKVFRFTFDSGDEFECENADDYPTLTNGGEDGLAMTGTVPYGAGGGGTGGGVLIANMSVVDEHPTLDRTWAEIYDAPVTFVSFVAYDKIKCICPVYEIGTQLDILAGEITSYYVDVVMFGSGASFAETPTARFSAATEDGVLTYAGE